MMNIAVRILTWISGFFVGLGLFLEYPLLEPKLMLVGIVCLVVVFNLIARERENKAGTRKEE